MTEEEIVLPVSLACVTGVTRGSGGAEAPTRLLISDLGIDSQLNG